MIRALRPLQRDFAHDGTVAEDEHVQPSADSHDRK